SGVKTVEKLGIRVSVLTEIILRSDRYRIHGQAEGARFVLYPAQGYVREQAVFVTATDVAVRADEPALLELLPRRGVRIPQRGHVIQTMLIDGDRVICVFNDVAQFGVVELIEFHVDILENVERNAKSADGVPNADEFDLLGTVRRLRLDRLVKTRDVGFDPLIGRQGFIRRFVPGSVKANHDSLHVLSSKNLCWDDCTPAL